VRDIDDLVKKLVGEARAAESPKRGGPRSRLVDAIMVLLLSRPMRSAEIARLLGYDTKYISSYLSYWKTRGYVEYQNGYWSLTPKGEDYAAQVLERETSEDSDRMATIAKRILAERNLTATRDDKKLVGSSPRRRKSLSFTAAQTIKGDNIPQERVRRAHCFLQILAEDLDQDEFEALSSLLAHYSKWGSTYIYLDNLAETMKADYTWLLRVMRRLQSKGIVYIYTDPRLGIRVGLTKSSKEMLAECSFD